MSRNNAETSTSSPLLNDYKRNFFLKRSLQTLLGGPIFKFNSAIHVPPYIYILQVIFLIFPFLFGGISILIHDLINTGKWNLYVSIIAGGVYFVLILILKIITLSVVNKSQSSKNVKLGTKTPKLLSDEENFEFTSLFSKSTFEFLVSTSNKLFIDPSSKSKVNFAKLFSALFLTLFDSLLAGFIMFCSVYFESIVYLQKFYSLGPSIVLFIFHWIVLLVSFYPLCFRDPLEPAVYQPYNDLNVNRYTRIFYVFCFQIIELIYNFSPDSAYIPSNVIFYLKIFYSCLPITWFLGMLPPIDSFLLWLFEQSYIHLYGGTATASNLRLIIQLILSVIVSMAHFIPSDIAIVVIFSAFGYILSSIDFLFLIEWIKFKINFKRSKVTPIKTDIVLPSKTDSRYFPLNWKDWLYHLIVLSVTIAVSIVIFIIFNDNFKTYDIPFLIETILLYIGIGIFLICQILGNLQSVYLFFGLIRNPFYPRNSLSVSLSKEKKELRSINQNKIFFRILKYTRLVLIKLISPLILCVIISIDCHMNKIYNDKNLSYWRTLCVLRAFRWVWQSNYFCLFEMCSTHLILFTISYNTVADQSSKNDLIKYYLTGCLVASFVRDRMIQLINKVYAYILITITAWTIKKQRRRLALVFLVINLVFIIPNVIFVIIPSTILSAPLLPLFTFPIFLFSFPRPKKFWPQKNKLFSHSINLYDENFRVNETKNPSSSDAYFYSQLIPDLVKSFKELIRSGSIGQCVQADTFFLSRFQDRIIWIQVLESANSYYVINIKGLELQETSCHTREAQYIDDLFDLSFENPNGTNSNSEKKLKFLSFNKRPFNCLSSKDLLLMTAYSDAKNSLVGILDYPENLDFLCKIYPKVLHYFLIEYLFHKNKNLKPKSLQEIPVSLKASRISIKSEKEPENFALIPLNNSIFEDNNELIADSAISKKNIVLKNKNEINDSFDDWSDNDSDLESKKNSKKKLTKPKLSIPSEKYKEENKAPFDFDLDEILGTNDNKTENIQQNAVKTEIKKDLNNSKKERDSPRNLLKNKLIAREITQEKIDLPLSILSLPTEWISLMNESLTSTQSLNNEDLKNCLMSKKWIEKITEISKILVDQKDKVLNDYETNFWTSHYKFILKCLQTLGMNEKSVKTNYSPESINNLYNGDLPWTPTNEKIKQNYNDLHSLLVKSFRYAIKMVIDHATLSPITDNDEFFETLDSYVQDWFIGSENDEEFSRQINLKKPYLFSLLVDSKKKLSSRNLSLQQIRSPLAKLNNEIVKSIWSSTNLELLYMTNDDEERYSIQAHDYILRNLTIQSSDPPLGYSVYNSDNVYISIANPFFE